MRYIFDLETLKNTFTATFLNVEDQSVSVFVIHQDRDDSQKLREFLGNCKELVGFNNVDFDYPILDYFLTKTLPKRPDTIARHLYNEAQRIIEAKNAGEFVNIRNPSIRQFDLFKIHHFDRPERYTSLKYVAINLGFPNIQDMPISHTEEITIDQIPLVLEYNLNDVLVTYEFYKKTLSKIELRDKLSDKYQVDMTNFSDPKIGETIVLSKLSDKLNQPMSVLKKCRTYRKELRLKDVILPSISFRTPEFQRILDEFNGMVITDTRKSGDLVATLDDLNYYFGFGGIHGCRGNGVYRNINSCDVGGYYPSLAIAQGFYPHHFGTAFVEVYGEIAKERAMYPKGTSENVAMKLAQNGVFGKSNNEYSPFYDPMFFAKITINGQLLLAMLCERITTMEVGKVILANTDGLEIEVYDQVKYEWLCGEWEKRFGVRLEHGKYRLLAVRDINNYLSMTDKGKIKLKGAFKTVKALEEDEEYHKDFSQGIVAEAVSQYFLNQVPVEDTINNCSDRRLFLIGNRAKQGKFVLKGIRNGELYEEEMPKHLRYYISKGGGSLVKTGTKAATSMVQKGYQVTIMNQLGELKNLNRQYYVKEARKLIESII
jgi:hypothetical protein